MSANFLQETYLKRSLKLVFKDTYIYTCNIYYIIYIHLLYYIHVYIQIYYILHLLYINIYAIFDILQHSYTLKLNFLSI